VKEVYVSIKGVHIESQNKSGAINIGASLEREISREDIQRVVDIAKAIQLPADKEIIQTITKNFSVDGQSGISNPLGMEGTHLSVNVHIITGLTATTNNLIKCVNNAGFDCAQLISSVIAAGEVTVSQDEKKIGCVLLDMGAQTTDIAVYFDGAIQYLKEIPLGGDDITWDIAHGLGASFPIAQEVKEKYGSAVPSLVHSSEEVTYLYVDGMNQKTITKRALSDFIKPRVEEILEFVDVEIKKVKSKNMFSSGVVITGGGCQLLGMKEACENILKMPARIGIPQNITGSVNGITDPAMSCAMGLTNYKDLLEGEEIADQGPEKSGIFSGIKSFFNKSFG
jgi:cell division protein FtsA